MIGKQLLDGKHAVTNSDRSSCPKTNARQFSTVFCDLPMFFLFRLVLFCEILSYLVSYRIISSCFVLFYLVLSLYILMLNISLKFIG